MDTASASGAALASDFPLLRRTRELVRSPRGRALWLSIGALYGTLALYLGHMLMFYPTGNPGVTVQLITDPANPYWWNFPALVVDAPGGSLVLPFTASISVLVLAVGVGLGMSAGIELTLRVLAQRGGRSAGAGLSTVLTGASPAFVALLTLGACCSTSAAAAAGMAGMAPAGSEPYDILVTGDWYLGVVEILVVGVAMAAQEQLLGIWTTVRPRPDPSGAAPSGATRSDLPTLPKGVARDLARIQERGERTLDRRFVLGLVLRVALLVGGLTWSLSMLLAWESTPLSDAGWAAWYHWLFQEQLLGITAVVVALFPRGTTTALVQGFTRPSDRVQLLVLRGALLVAGISWGLGVPPPLAALGLGGLGNQVLGVMGVTSGWAAVPTLPWGVPLLFQWTFENLLLSGFALALALRPLRAMAPLLWTSASPDLGAPTSSKAEPSAVPSHQLRRSSAGLPTGPSREESRPRVPALTVAVILVAAAVLVVAAQIPSPSPAPYSGVLRTYYIAANEVEWNYTPAGMNEISGEPFGVDNITELQYTSRNATYLGTTFLKCVYQQYADANFSQVLPRPPNQAYLGILGPVIYGVVGDTIQVYFQNNCRFPEGIVPQGLTLLKGGDGYVYPGSTQIFEWYVPPEAGPGIEQPQTTLWSYTSPWSPQGAGPPPTLVAPGDSIPIGDDPANNTDTGLIGPILISSPGAANPNGTPIVPQIIDAFAIFSEDNSPYLSQNILDDALDPAAVFTNEANPNWLESLHKYTINGYLYGNQPMVQLVVGGTYQWDLMDVGFDMHAVHWHGNTVIFDGMRTDLVPLLPSEDTEAIMVPDDPGIWLFHCHVDDHLAGGMVTRYEVVNATGPGPRGTANVSSIPAAGGSSSIDLVGVASGSRRSR